MSKHIVYEEDTANGWIIHVKRDEEHIGNITKNPNNGHYQYFAGQHNFRAMMFGDQHLDAVKKKIEHSPLV